MTTIYKRTSNWSNNLTWDNARTREYPMQDGGVIETWLIGKAENAQNFALRYYNVAIGSSTRQESHAHDHGIFILHGDALILLGNELHATTQGDVIYVPPHTEHQIKNIGAEPLGFLCIIPARRKKGNTEIWAETGLVEGN